MIDSSQAKINQACWEEKTLGAAGQSPGFTIPSLFWVLLQSYPQSSQVESLSTHFPLTASSSPVRRALSFLSFGPGLKMPLLTKLDQSFLVWTKRSYKCKHSLKWLHPAATSAPQQPLFTFTVVFGLLQFLQHRPLSPAQLWWKVHFLLPQGLLFPLPLVLFSLIRWVLSTFQTRMYFCHSFFFYVTCCTSYQRVDKKISLSFLILTLTCIQRVQSEPHCRTPVCFFGPKQLKPH